LHVRLGVLVRIVAVDGESAFGHGLYLVEGLRFRTYGL
jgi:hypothetical protein